jgi:hypothetical protein
MTTPVDTVRRFYDAPVTLRPIVPRRLSTLWKDGFRSPDSSPAWTPYLDAPRIWSANDSLTGGAFR